MNDVRLRNFAKRALRRVTLLLLGSALFMSACDTPTEVLCGPGAELPQLPNATLYTCDAQPFDLLQYVASNDVTYITFGALWCTACQKEVATINSEVVEHFDGQKVGVLQILVEDQLAEPPTEFGCVSWEDSLDPQFTILTDLDQATLPQHFPDGISILPYHLIVTSDGSIRYDALGPMTADLQKLLEPWLSTP